MPNTPLQESPSVVEDSDEEKILNDLQEVFLTSPTQCNKEKGSLRIAPSEKGLYVGGLVFSQGMTTINCANMGTRGVSIPSDAHEMSSIDTAIDRRISEGRLAGRMAF
ncbi:hypothetical protein Tco_0513339 [Tanacetum coccineum]